MLIKPLSTWIKTNQPDGYTYYFDPETAMLTMMILAFLIKRPYLRYVKTN